MAIYKVQIQGVEVSLFKRCWLKKDIGPFS